MPLIPLLPTALIGHETEIRWLKRALFVPTCVKRFDWSLVGGQDALLLLDWLLLKIVIQAQEIVLNILHYQVGIQIVESPLLYLIPIVLILRAHLDIATVQVARPIIPTWFLFRLAVGLLDILCCGSLMLLSLKQCLNGILCIYHGLCPLVLGLDWILLLRFNIFDK